MDSGSTVAVVTVPFPAQGHLNQLLHLSLLLASRGLPVHFAAPEPHLREARARLHGWGGGGSVRFRALDIPAHASPAPDPASPFPEHMQPLFEAFCAGARAPLAALLRELSASHRRVVVLHDRMAAFAAAEAARLPNGVGEALGVHCLAASYNVGWADPGHALLRRHGLVFHPPDACATGEFVALARRMGQERRRAPGAGMVVNTCRALEGEFLDVLAGIPSSDGPRLFAVGPLNPVLLPDPDPDPDPDARAAGAGRDECLAWLDAQPPSSVLYVSFGTTSSLREEQVRELAAALRDSGRRFVWVLRDADRADMRSGEAAAESRLLAAAASELGDATAGVLLTGWAPQLEILAHGATAAFMSHCGWNSTVESLSHGKPILAWPMHSDQPWDAELACKYLRAGLLVRPWEQRHDVTPAAAIRQAIETVMASDEGAEMRRRASALGEAVRAAVAEGGSSRQDLEELVAYVTR
ncbi:hypothetical protein BS78_02G378500 [Paspalum vaginatum]|nr:hypothetical protein BS78_02G378500 [Paspalum vaginatum]